MEGIELWLAARLPLRPTLVSGSALDVGFDGIEFLDPPQCLFGDRRLRVFKHLEQLASSVRHASHVGNSRCVSAIGAIQRLVCVFRSKSARHSDLMSAGDYEVKSAIPI